MRYKILASMLIVLGFLLSSCEDNLDIEKKGNYGSEDTFYETDDDAEQAITAAYYQWNASAATLFFTLDALSDDVWAGGGTRGDITDVQNINEYRYGTDNSYVSSIFSSLYSIIYYSNLVIERVDTETDVRKRCVAEAYFFRGWAHFYLGALWGTAPVVDHLLSADEYAQGNSADGELYAQAASDFKTAIDMDILPSKESVNDTETSIRITEECAYAFYGKTLLFQGNNSEAAAAFDKVINSGLYELYTGDYGDIHKTAGEFCCESILENNQVDDTQTAWTFYTYVQVWRGWRSDGISFANIKSDYSDVTSGYGFMNPRADLYNSFKEYSEDGGSTYRLDQSIKDIDFLIDEMGLTISSTNHGNEGYFNWKMRAMKDELIYDMNGWNVCVSTNIRFMRYAEVLLRAAEANLTVNSAKSLEYINQVRNRAQLSSLTTVSLDDIKEECRYELCFEGTRFIDLVRWGDAATKMADQGKEVMCLNTDGTVSVEYTTTSSGFVAGKHEHLPIPATELLLNSNIQQNSGWSSADVDYTDDDE